MGMAIAVPRYTTEDLEQFPDDGNRYELLDGVLLVTPAARRMHQVVAGRLHVRLALAVEEVGLAQIVSPGVVVQVPRTQLQPDILVQPARFALEKDWSRVTDHWLAIEVLSRSSRVYDREIKRGAYFALGVREVWLVDIPDKSVEIWRRPSESTTARESLVWRVPTVDLDVTIDLLTIFEGT
ncbi:MAG: Uma2 family endonuclease [Gemmatimonas sp.]